jgi:CelD/BcsL family acetyltransferase involved in cellulose biosynthesis
VLGLCDVDPELREGWRELAGAAVEPNPFYEADPVLAAAELLRDGSAAALLVVDDDDGGEVHLALPVLRRRYRRVPVPALVAWQHAYCFAGAPLLRRGREHEAWAEALDHGKFGYLEAWLVLERLPLHGPAAVALQDVLAERVARPAALDRFGRPVLLRRPAATYLDGRLSGRHRKTLRRQRRRLGDELGAEVEAVDVAASGDVEAGIEDLLRLELRGWKGRAGTAMACRPGDAAWFRRFCTGLHAEGRLELWALRGGGRVAAWQANVLGGDTVFHFKIAYDEELARFSPGMQLEVEMVEQFHRDARLRRIDSCVDPDNHVSAQLYPDREVLATMTVPTRVPTGPLAVGSAVLATRARAAQTAVERRVRRGKVDA